MPLPLGPDIAPEMQFAPLEAPPLALSDGNAVAQRVMELRAGLEPHLQRLRKLDRYSRREPANWFPGAQINVRSVVRSTIRAAEKTAIAYLAGGTPTWRVASYAGYAGQAQGDEIAGKRDARFERIARAIFHHIDRQSEVNVLYEPVRRAVREGEIIMQYGWLPEHLRRIGPVAPAMLDGDTSPDAPPDLVLGDPKWRFPLMVKVLSRTKVFYELNTFGEPVEVYHAFTARASTIQGEYPEWQDNRNPNDPVAVVEAWVGGWRGTVIDGSFITPPHRHHYGERPPFVIERCAPEEIEPFERTEFGAEVVAGTPFCADMIEAFEQACVASSLKRVVLENSAIGAYQLKKSGPGRRGPSGSGEANSQVTLGPGTIFFSEGDEDLVPLAPPPLPPALAAFLEESERDMAELSFSSALLRGDASGDPSGYSIEQIRQAAMARLMPYRDALERSFSRLFERLFEVLALPGHWAPEWGQVLTLAGSFGGEFFVEQVTPQDLVPPPQHVEVMLTPAVPQNKIAERQAAASDWQAGMRDILSLMEEGGVADPQEELNSIIVHKFQLEDPMGLAAAAMGILQERAQKMGQQLPAMAPVMGVAGAIGGMPPGGPQGAPGGMPGQVPGQQPAPPGPGTPRPNQGPPGPGMRTPPAGPATSGPAPMQRPALAPLGVAGAPNPPVPINTKKRPPGR